MPTYLDKIELFSGREKALLKEGLHGLEKECLRVSSKKVLAQTTHPLFMGASLTHPYFTTDFAEAQLELVTPPFATPEGALEHLEDLHLYIHHNMKEEWLWPMSSPCSLPDKKEIELAKFGYTKEGYEKWLYRRGLSYRYGKAMQLLSGIHHSFSFSKKFWEFYHKALNSKQSLESFQTDNYLHVTRNFLRVGWICSYLFGSSPIVDKTYLDKPCRELKSYCKDSYHAPFGTSIRMSHLGYFSKIQSQNAVSFNNLDEYLKDLKYMLDTPSLEFQKIGEYKGEKRIQMNENILQIEAEHYARIRLKPKHRPGERPLHALKRGVSYFETRILDLNPFCEAGLDLTTLHFMHLLFVYCLFEKSPPIRKEERHIICDNQNKVALEGRKKGLKLIKDTTQKEVTLKNWSLEIMDQMREIASLFDKGDPQKSYQNALELQIEKVNYPYLTPSTQILETLIKKKQSFTSFSYQKAKAHKSYFTSQPLSKKLKSNFQKLAQESLLELEKKEEAEDYSLSGYEDMELSTQLIIKEAMKQNLQFKILDRKANMISLIRGEKEEWIKQATQTRLDPLISYFLMENKKVTKKILQENKIETPLGKSYTSLEKALEEYSLFETKKIVVKPNLTNMGHGISFVEPRSPKKFHQALITAAEFESEILVEEFFPGEEYRLLVIDNKVEAVCQRIPAHVEGDGKASIQELIRLKNKRNEAKIAYQKPLNLTQKEKGNLLTQGYKPSDIPKKGELVFLMENSNVSTGGESIDFTDRMPAFYKKVACKAAQSVQATICGVDMIIQGLKKEPSSKSYKIIELNFNPALYLHRYPAKGKKRYVEKAILKALGF